MEFGAEHEKDVANRAPYVLVSVPNNLVQPLGKAASKDYRWQFGKDLKPLLGSIIASLDEESPLRRALRHPNGDESTFAFRGIKRDKRKFRKAEYHFQDSTYSRTRKNIEKFGFDKNDPGYETWLWIGLPEMALIRATPKNQHEVGILLIYNAEGLTYKEGNVAQGIVLPEGKTLKDFYVGAVEISVEPSKKKNVNRLLSKHK